MKFKYKIKDSKLFLPEFDFVADIKDNYIYVPDMETLDKDFVKLINDCVESVAKKLNLNVCF